jgi:hypothetical protein
MAASIWTVVLLFSAMTLGRSRRSFQFGLAAAIVAYLALIGIATPLISLWPTAPAWTLVLIAAPLIEESSRLSLAVEVRKQSYAPLAFGLGYGLFEAGLKFADLAVLAIRDPIHPLVTVVSLLGPIVPLLLHVFISVLVFSLLRRGISLPKVWFSAVLIHAVHNWTVVFFATTEFTHLAGALALRTAIFLGLIVILLPQPGQPKPPGEGAPG